MDEHEEPRVLEDLTEDEAYLYAILSDPSGLDQAEFLWVDYSSEDNRFCPVCGSQRDGVHRFEHPEIDFKEWTNKYPAPSVCFRAWAFQWPWWRDRAPLTIDQMGRSLGKSLSIKLRACAFPFLFPGQEMVITAPELVHLEPIVSLVEAQLYSTRVLSEIVVRGKGGVTHRPFQCNFSNGSRIIGRIPQRDGRGVKGIHPVWLELDEAQDYPHAGWVELRETLKRGSEGAMWRAHGVTKGVRDDFYESTQDSPDNPWKVHRFSAMWRPNWTDRERQEALEKYGSREDPDYRRNILGLHGDKTNPIFVLSQLMKNVDADPVSAYNTDEYFKVVTKIEQLEMFDQTIADLLDFPAGHLSYAGDTIQMRRTAPKAVYWCGMDIGFTLDPSEILVFVEYREKPRDQYSRIKLLTRISMARMPHRDQLWAMLHTIEFYRPRAFSMDKTGLGLPLFQELQEYMDAFRGGRFDEIPAWMRHYDLNMAVNTVKGYNFSEKLIVDFDSSIEVSDYEDPVTKAGMRRNAVEYATDVLREMVDRNQLWLPWDDELLKQFQGGTWTSSRSMDAYGRRSFSKGNDHCVAEGTLVETARGPVPIEDVRAGDYALTTRGLQYVSQAWQVAPAANVVEIVTDDIQTVTVTSDHRILTRYGWIPAGGLSTADRVATCAGSEASFVRVVAVRPLERVMPVYDLSVDHQHEFVAGGIVVSNCLDAARMMALGWAQHTIEEMLRDRTAEPVFDTMLAL